MSSLRSTAWASLGLILFAIAHPAAGESRAGQDHWAYQSPSRTEPPAVKDESRVRNWIDPYILTRLKKEGLSPAPEADRVTLIRRLSFDLTGLPPTPRQVERFVNDDSPDAYRKLVNRLLGSPRFGERMAMYWLDLVRYADTVGYHGDQDHRIWPYRDYVIESFNANKPFDQFTIEQLAGDLLEDPTLQQKVATGYNRVLQTSHEGGVQPEEYLAIYAADRVRNLSVVWMGATVGCAECHDHKYDPYTMRDFYSMEAFFADIDEARHFDVGNNSLPSRRPPEMRVPSDAQQRKLAELDERLKRLEAERTEKNAEKVDKQIERIKKERKKIRENAPKTMVTESIEPRTIRILPRGNWLDDSGEVVQPAVPHFLPEPDAAGERRLTRLDLARWLTSTEDGVGGLTARVFVNRLWYLMFGVGLSKSLDDFGGQGEPPVYPELLDRLAVEFVDSGWDIKHMVRLIVTSSAYRQSSLTPDSLAERDPNNRLYARQSRHRLPAEMIRDNALAVSGLLVRKVGGPSVKPYQPDGYYKHLNFPKRSYEHHTDSRQHRRGVYMHWQRTFLHPMLKAFDAPTREECTAQRPVSNTPNAALALLNDPTFVEAARAFAVRILREGGEDDTARLRFAFRWATSRQPEPREVELVRRLLEKHRDDFASDPSAARRLMQVGLTEPSEDLDRAELAAWTSVARAILNLNETITRN